MSRPAFARPQVGSSAKSPRPFATCRCGSGCLTRKPKSTSGCKPGTWARAPGVANVYRRTGVIAATILREGGPINEAEAAQGQHEGEGWPRAGVSYLCPPHAKVEARSEMEAPGPVLRLLVRVPERGLQDQAADAARGQSRHMRGCEQETPPLYLRSI